MRVCVSGDGGKLSFITLLSCHDKNYEAVFLLQVLMLLDSFCWNGI